MPSLEEHCQHSLKMYGVRADDVHMWLDEPCRAYGPKHRQFRHDEETVGLCGEIFSKKYSKEFSLPTDKTETLIENIALDHIMLDHKESIKKRKVVTAKHETKWTTIIVPKTLKNRLDTLMPDVPYYRIIQTLLDSASELAKK